MGFFVVYVLSEQGTDLYLDIKKTMLANFQLGKTTNNDETQHANECIDVVFDAKFETLYTIFKLVLRFAIKNWRN